MNRFQKNIVVCFVLYLNPGLFLVRSSSMGGTVTNGPQTNTLMATWHRLPLEEDIHTLSASWSLRHDIKVPQSRTLK